MFKTKWLGQAPAVALVVVLLVSVSACSGRTKGPSPNSYGNDGYLGLSNSNPHLPNKNGQFLNYGSDGEFVTGKMKELPGVADVNVVFQGIDLYVTLIPKANTDEAALYNEATAVLQKNMPRYKIHLNVQK